MNENTKSKKYIDLTGRIFGELTVIRRATKEERPKDVYWLCKCSCGNNSFVKTGNLNNGHCTRCWECAHYKSNSHKRIDLTNKRFGRLVVLEMIYPDRKKSDTVYCKCLCDCGNIKILSKRDVCSGHTTSCGCMRTSSLERNVELILKDLNYNYEKEYTFDDCIHINKLKFDFVIFDDDNNIIQIIETDGKQHYEANNFFGGEEGFKITQLRDNIKNEYRESHNIPLLRLPYYLSKEEMENEIKKVI